MLKLCKQKKYIFEGKIQRQLCQTYRVNARMSNMSFGLLWDMSVKTYRVNNRELFHSIAEVFYSIKERFNWIGELSYSIIELSIWIAELSNSIRELSLHVQ